MDKGKLKRAISTLRKGLSDSEDVTQALEFLSKAVDQLVSMVSTETKSKYPIPSQLLSDSAAIALFSDGACRGNPGVGAWGMLGQNGQGDIIFEDSGFESDTTNNKMELLAAINALEFAKEWLQNERSGKKTSVYLFSDSKYVVDGIEKWIFGWKRRGWKKADGKIPENLEFWQRLDQIRAKFERITFLWVKGHAGHPQNERCDQLANIAIDEMI